MSLKQLNIILSIICLVFIAFGCNSSTEKEGNSEGDESVLQQEINTSSVEVVKPSYHSFISRTMITGVAKAYRKVMVHPMESGYVQSIGKDIGDLVYANDAIAVLYNPELLREAEKLKAELIAKKAIYERLKSIQENTPSLSPVQKLEAAKADYLSTQADLSAINDRISLLTVKAPFTGRITKKMVNVGDLVQSGINNSGTKPLVELQQTHPIRLTVTVPESDASFIKVGLLSQINFPEMPNGNYYEKVTRTAKALEASSKTMQVEIDIANKSEAILPGMYAKVTMELSSRDNVLSLPSKTKTMIDDAPHILVVNNGLVEKIALQIGLENANYYELLNSNINDSTLVITRGKNLVKTGNKVYPVLKKSEE
jgi:RND family efflux transporter MFP subunit